MKTDELANKKIVAIDIVDDPGRDHEIQITTECGRVFRFYHSQDCCESVKIAAAQDGDGSLLSLIGKQIREVTQEELRDDDTETSYDSWTKTTITFRTDSETVISRWIGESNGYYSEDVDLEEIFKESE